MVIQVLQQAAWQASLFLNHDSYFAVIALIGLAIAFFISKNKASLFAATVITMALIPFVKMALKDPRPCDLQLPTPSYCSTDFGMPSSHAAFSFLIAFSLFGREQFPIALLFAILVSASRVLIGAHSIIQVIGGMALAGVAFFASKQLLARQDEKAEAFALKKLGKS